MATVENNKPSNKTVAMAAAVAAVLVGGGTYLLLSRGGQGSPYAPATLHAQGSSQPRRALVSILQLLRLRDGKGIAAAATTTTTSSSSSSTSSDQNVTLLADLVFLLRGGAESKPPVTVGGGEKEKEKVQPARAPLYQYRVPPAFIEYLNNSYLPALRRQQYEEETNQPNSTTTSSYTPQHKLEHQMLEQLARGDFEARKVDVDRAAQFLPPADKPDAPAVLNNTRNTYEGVNVASLLQELWTAGGLPAAQFQLTSPGWSALGFQGENPLTDLRASGLTGLRHFVHFAKSFPNELAAMRQYNSKVQGEGRDSWYLIAVVSFQLTAQLVLSFSGNNTNTLIPLYRNHLAVIYDTVPASPSTAGAKGYMPVTSREELLRQASTGAGGKEKEREEALAEVWRQQQGSVEAGLTMLHHLLFLHFKACWERDEPHVMEYNNYIQSVYKSFFNKSWTVPEDFYKNK